MHVSELFYFCFWRASDRRRQRRRWDEPCQRDRSLHSIIKIEELYTASELFCLRSVCLFVCACDDRCEIHSIDDPKIIILEPRVILLSLLLLLLIITSKLQSKCTCVCSYSMESNCVCSVCSFCLLQLPPNKQLLHLAKGASLLFTRVGSIDVITSRRRRRWSQGEIKEEEELQKGLMVIDVLLLFVVWLSLFMMALVPSVRTYVRLIDNERWRFWIIRVVRLLFVCVNPSIHQSVSWSDQPDSQPWIR